MISGHVIDMRELRAREIAEMERRHQAQQRKYGEQRRKYECQSRLIQDATIMVCQIYGHLLGSVLIGALLNDLDKLKRTPT